MSTPVTYLRRKCVILPLVLKGKWYDMIAAGEKREEYRDATAYWAKRLWNWNTAFTEATIPVVEFRRGYAKDAPRMAFWCMGIETSCGLMPYAYVDATATKRRHPEWGEPDEPHYFIELGGRIELSDTGNTDGNQLP